jgi:UDP-glucose-4-epimerase GalE
MAASNILITGGAGYIGSHTAKALAQSGFVPVVLDNLSFGNRWAVKWGPFVQGDIADEELLRRTIKKHHISGVLHFAASAYVGESMLNPRKYFHNNVTKSLCLLNAMMDCGVDQLVFSSTCAVYGIPEKKIVDEDHPQSPVNPYGETKLFVERACHWYEQAHQLRSVCLRYFNAAGADMDGELGESHDPETHLIPLAIEAALDNTRKLKVHGSDFPTPDGTAVRDFIHVADLAAAHVSALQHLANGGESARLNLGTGTGTSVREVIRLVKSIAGRRVQTVEAPARPGDPPYLVACADRAKELLGWQPEYNIEETIASAWEWHSSRVPSLADASERKSSCIRLTGQAESSP